MAYEKRVWSETEKETAYPSDFNRIEEGIEVNDLEITNQKNPTIPGTLANKINVLNYDRGYLSTLGTRFSTAIKNGKYIVSSDTDCPDGSTESTWLIDVTQMNDSYVLQEAFCLYSPIGNTGRKYYRYMVNNVWQPWIEFATTKRTIITEYFNSWTPWAGAYHLRLDIIGGRCICSGILAIGVKDNGTLICNIPVGYRPTKGLEPRILSGNNSDNLQVTIDTNGQMIVDTSAQTPWSKTASTLLDFTCSWEV